MKHERNYVKWSTILSGCTELYFIKLVHSNDLRLTVADRDNVIYEVIIDNPGPYRVVDEQFLVEYWGAGVGWTFIIEKTNEVQWDDIPVELLDLYMEDYKHYVIATWDYCLNVIAQKEPKIVRIG